MVFPFKVKIYKKGVFIGDGIFDLLLERFPFGAVPGEIILFSNSSDFNGTKVTNKTSYKYSYCWYELRKLKEIIPNKGIILNKDFVNFINHLSWCPDFSFILDKNFYKTQAYEKIEL